MPTYTYQCKKCGAAQDEFHAMSAAPAVKCAHCGSIRMQKMPGAGAGIIFKGSGFYETDYKRSGANGKGETKPESKTDSNSDSKPAEPTKAAPSTKAAETKKTVPAT